ncbi:MAG: 7-carboxy-7-deazaguanine synthase QueE [Chitinophagaceae bacterium]|nr:7-carboxy-7-deazaguanine synthase QueE [Chitinophagaceae bacterium]MBP9739165.1 7-carboxy-7-deazaguanine synthase QueE [Chitinophagaceae bacterium]
MESFYTLQGEGLHAGKAAYFIRLGGCDVGCVWCDVKESWDADAHPKFSVEAIVEKAIEESGIKKLTPSTLNLKPLVVITGGEPLLHNLNELTAALQQAGFETNIETSGSSALSGNWNWICLSPKKFKAPLQEVIVAANELKVVVFNKHDFEWAETYAAQVNANCKLYLQAEWDKKEIVTPLIIDYIKNNPQWQLSVQIHKYINVP